MNNNALSIKSSPDSLLFDEQIDYCSIYDSLYFSYLNNNTTTNIQVSEGLFMPDFSDSMVQIRIAEMNTLSPFEFMYNDEVRKYIIFFGQKRQGMISRALSKANHYFPVFEELLDKYNLPLELKYLAVVESSLNPNAISRAGAGGLWQFMPGTGKMYGLTYTSILDERREMYEATEAACRHFVDLYNLFGDWNLVLAAYNAGSGRISRALKYADSSAGYWEVYKYLPKETQGYVPAFTAVNYLMHYHIQHNIFPAADYESHLNLTTDTIHVYHKISFQEIAKQTNVSIETIKALNPQYLKGYIPAAPNKAMILRLPVYAIADLIEFRYELVATETKTEAKITQ